MKLKYLLCIFHLFLNVRQEIITIFSRKLKTTNQWIFLYFILILPAAG